MVFFGGGGGAAGAEGRRPGEGGSAVLPEHGTAMRMSMLALMFNLLAGRNNRYAVIGRPPVWEASLTQITWVSYAQAKGSRLVSGQDSCHSKTAQSWMHHQE